MAESKGEGIFRFKEKSAGVKGRIRARALKEERIQGLGTRD